MLFSGNITELVAQDLSIAHLTVDVRMAVTIYPVVYPAGLDELIKVGCEGCPERACLMFRRNSLQGWCMMGNNHYMLCCRLRDGITDKPEALDMFLVVFLRSKDLTIVTDLMEVIQSTPDGFLVDLADPAPERGQDEVRIIDMHDLVVVVADIREDFLLPAPTALRDVAVVIVFMISWHHEDLTVVPACPVKNVMSDGFLKVHYITGKQQDIACHFPVNGVQEITVVFELQMKVTHVLYFHATKLQHFLELARENPEKCKISRKKSVLQIG